jgi:hypothetical protein
MKNLAVWFRIPLTDTEQAATLSAFNILAEKTIISGREKNDPFESQESFST